MSNKPENCKGASRFSREAIRAPLNKLLNGLYLVMIVFFIFEEYVIWTGAYINEPFGQIWNFCSPKIIAYTPPILLSILLLDTYINGVRLRKIALAIIGIFLTIKLNGIAYNNHFEFFFWYVIAYPTNLNFRKSITTFIIASASFLVITICLWFIGALVDVQQYQHGVIRHSLGFFIPNAFAIVSTSLVMAWVYWKSPTWNWRYALISLGLLIVFFTISDGRSAFAIGVLQIAITSLFSSSRIPQKLKGACSKGFFKGAIWLFPILGILSIAILPLLSITTDTSLYGTINATISGRFSGFLYHFNEQGIPLFSQPFDTKNPCDNAFLAILWSCGLIPLIYFSVLYVVLGKECERRNDLPLAIFIVLFLLHCITESIVFLLIINITILAIGSALANPSAKARTFASMHDESAQND